MLPGVSAVLLLTAALPFLFLIIKRLLKSGWDSGEARRPKPAENISPLNPAETDKLIAFLEEADDAYIRAYQYRSLGGFIQYISRELAIETQQKITYYNDKIWGTPAHRKRAWSIVSADGQAITVRKELTFKNVKYGKMLVKLGDDCVEYWRIVYDGPDKRYKIRAITC